MEKPGRHSPARGEHRTGLRPDLSGHDVDLAVRAAAHDLIAAADGQAHLQDLVARRLAGVADLVAVAAHDASSAGGLLHRGDHVVELAAIGQPVLVREHHRPGERLRLADDAQLPPGAQARELLLDLGAEAALPVREPALDEPRDLRVLAPRDAALVALGLGALRASGGTGQGVPPFVVEPKETYNYILA